MGSAQQAFAARYSSIVIDAESGNVISEYDADRPNYPASLTKMMTLYLTFEALEQGKLRLDQRFLTSRHAADQEPTKLGLVAGETVALKDLILGLVTQSANDAAVVIAEGIAGSEAAFAARMTAKAGDLGMTNTVFVNASGLPNPRQKTTARDLAKLARALYRNFPREYAYFATEEFTFQGVTYSNHNHLMASFQGMDGIKTGFIRASGFNLAASATRDGRRLIGIVMGGTSAHARDLKMADLLNAGFLHRGAPDVIVTADQSDSAKIGRFARRAAHTLARLSPIGRAEAATTGRALPRPHAKEAQGWSIQIGAYTHHEAALRAGSAALARLPAASSKSVMVLASHAGKTRVFRTRIASFSEPEAQKAYRTLHRQHKSCAVVAPAAAQMTGAHSSNG